MGYLFINYLIKETNFHFQSSACHTLKAILHQPYSMVLFSEFLRIDRCALKLEHFLPRASELYSRMLSQGANQSCINKQILKDFQRYLEVLKNMPRTITNSFKNLKIIYLQIITVRLVLLACKICDEKYSYH